MAAGRMRVLGLYLYVLFTRQGPVTCGERCLTGFSNYEYCDNGCCDLSFGFYKYCCHYDRTSLSSVSSGFALWIIAPIVIGVIGFIASVLASIVCFCPIAAGGQTPYQAWTSRRAAATSIGMTSPVNQQHSTMSNLPYPQQQYQQANPMNQQPQTMG